MKILFLSRHDRILLRSSIFDDLRDFGINCIDILDYCTTFFSDSYSKHSEALIHTAFDDGCGATNRAGTKFYGTFFRFQLNSVLMQHFLQHLYTYQKLTNIPIYDEYKKWVLLTKKFNTLSKEIREGGKEKHKKLKDTHEDLRKQEQPMRDNFYKIFEELHSKATNFHNPPLGACKDCLKHTGSKWFKYSKWLKKKTKSDPNAWNHDEWA
jgi:hypothetical protein